MPPVTKTDLSPNDFRRSFNDKNHFFIGNKEEKEWLFDDALALIGYGKVQYALIILCGFMLISTISETIGMMLLITPSQCDLNLTTFDKGLLSVAAYVGIILPSYMWGYLCDRKGRRKVMIFTLLMTSMTAIGSSFAPDLLSFIILRFIVGFFVCASTGSVYPYLGEFMTHKKRPVAMAYSSFFIGIGMLFTSLTAWGVLSLDFKFPIYDEFLFRPWRLLPIIFTLPGLTAAILLLTYFEESPRYYIALGKEKETLRVLRWMYIKNTGEHAETYPVKKLINETSLDLTQDKADQWVLIKIWNDTIPLFKRPHVGNFLILCFMQVSTFNVSGGLGLWFTELQNRIDNSPDSDDTICGILESKKIENANFSLNGDLTICDDSVSTLAFIQSIILAAYYTVGFLVISLLMNFVGRKQILACSLLIASIAGILLHFVTHQLLQVIIFGTYLVLSGVMASVINGTAVMLIPTHLRAMALCIVSMTARIGTSITSVAVGATIETHCDATFGSITSMVIISALLNFLLPAK